ncbi:hypothetical protein Q7P35_002155 [Cladosporium inversicolor]
MNTPTQVQSASVESRIQDAIAAYKSRTYRSIRAAANAFSIPPSTLSYRLTGRTSRSQAHESEQILSHAEEKTLVRWLTRLTNTGFPASPALAIEMAEEIRLGRLQLSKTPPPSLRPISERWIDRFRARHPEILSVWTRQIERARHDATSSETLETWFDAVTELRIAHHYPPECIYNMDESGFAIGASQTSRALVSVREKSSWKVIAGRQEWITAIECVSATGAAIPPLIIFKAQHTNTAWIPAHTSRDWRFSTSNSGWTSDSHTYEWLTTVFEPETRPEDPQARRLLIMDGHGSHITANVIAHCMERAIDLLILPPHCSHILQPLDVSVFSPLKRALAAETDAVARLDAGRVSRVEWTQMYIRAREKAFTAANIKSGWRNTGLEPLSPIVVLDKYRQEVASTPPPPRIPPDAVSLDLTLLDSSPPDSTEVRKAMALFNSELQKPGPLTSPAKRFGERMTRILEMTQSENAVLRRELAEARELLRSRKNRRKGKRVALQGKFVFSTQEVLEIARQAEENAATKRGRKRPRTTAVDVEISVDEDEVLEIMRSDSESDCIIVANSRAM